MMIMTATKLLLTCARNTSKHPFIQATERYYKTESESFLAENSVSEYLKKAEERLKEEEDHVEPAPHATR
jgi:hypothetical protein